MVRVHEERLSAAGMGFGGDLIVASPYDGDRGYAFDPRISLALRPADAPDLDASVFPVIEATAL